MVLLVGCRGARREVPSEPATASPGAARASEPAKPAEPDGRSAPPAQPVAGPPPAETEDGVLHIVLRGQTAWRIAKSYGVTLDELVAANHLDDPAKLEVGQVLVIPGATVRRDIAPFPAPLAQGARPLDSPRVPRIDLLWPVEGGRVLSRFGDPRSSARRHAGLDLGADHGRPILAAADGVVLFSGTTRGGYGSAVILDHGQGLSTLYAHNSDVLVREGDRVRRGQRIAHVGATGNARGPHCHFEVRLEDVPLDPLAVLPTPAVGGAP